MCIPSPLRSRLLAVLVAALMVSSAAVPVSHTVPALAAARTLAPGYLHTRGTQILDSSGNPVRIAGITWYGMESTWWVPAGLDFQPYTHILDQVKALGYNTVRIPFSTEL